jgi:hypothetical protein
MQGNHGRPLSAASAWRGHGSGRPAQQIGNAETDQRRNERANCRARLEAPRGGAETDGGEPARAQHRQRDRQTLPEGWI